MATKRKSVPLQYFRTPESSNIVGFCYRSEANELYIDFKGDRSYLYVGVPKSVFDQLHSAPSVGKYHSESIREKYSYVELTDRAKKEWAQNWGVQNPEK